jgi:hypothetical protein
MFVMGNIFESKRAEEERKKENNSDLTDTRSNRPCQLTEFDEG